MEATAKQKREAWAKVEQLAEQTWHLLLEVNEGCVEQAQLMHIQAKAAVQQKLWEEPQ